MPPEMFLRSEARRLKSLVGLKEDMQDFQSPTLEGCFNLTLQTLHSLAFFPEVCYKSLFLQILKGAVET